MLKTIKKIFHFILWTIVIGWLGFILVSIDSIFTSKVYDIVFFTWSALAIISFVYLKFFAKD